MSPIFELTADFTLSFLLELLYLNYRGGVVLKEIENTFIDSRRVEKENLS